jgi:hypothetical protein
MQIELARAEKQEGGGEIGLDDGIYLEPEDPAWQSAWETTQAAIRLMRDDAEEAGARFLLMILSNAIQVNPDPQVRKEYAHQIGSTDLFLPDRRLTRFARRAGIDVLSVAPRLRKWAEENATCVHGFEAPWACQGHWNANGHRLAGMLLAEKLCSEIGEES